LSSRVILAGAADVFYNDPKAGRHEAITSRDTLNILADAISDVGSWWCWHVGGDEIEIVGGKGKYKEENHETV